jgi:GT2 family glycosyltransferase
VSIVPVSVLIGTRNRGSLLAETVRSILEGETLPAEIVIIDQSDVPAATDWQPTHPCPIVYTPTGKRGLSKARNAGAVAARNPLLAFTDDDMRADPGWLGNLVTPLLDGMERTVVTGRVEAGLPESSGAFTPAVVKRRDRTVFSGRIWSDPLAGGNMAMRKADFLDIGGFDERLGPGAAFPAGEDNDLGFRLLRNGYAIVYLPDAVLTHRAWRQNVEYLPLRYAYGRGKGAFYAKHWRDEPSYMPRRFVHDLLRRPLRAARRALRPRQAAGELAYAWGVIRGAAEWTSAGEIVPGKRDSIDHEP